MTMPSSAPWIGADVYTSDGDKLGKVKEVRGAYFKVAAPMQPDYWLGTESVNGGFGAGRVTVVFDKNHIDENKRDIGKA
jgi:hypothetical protein